MLETNRRGRPVPVDPYIAKGALRATSQDWSSLPTEVLDARRFYDPARSHDTKWHIGSYPLIVQRLGQHEKFNEWWEEAARQCRYLFARGCQPAAHISIFCRSGVHRSVACAVLLRNALLKLGYPVKLDHLAVGEWKRRNNCQGKCDGCSQSVDNTHAARTVFHIWQRCLPRIS